MGKVMINAGGGGGVSSNETNVVASQVLSGKTYLGADTNDEVGTGTMPNIAAVDTAKSTSFSNGTLHVRMSNGAHITNSSSGYPEVTVPGQTKTATPGASAVTVTPDANKVLEKVTVNAVSGLSAGNIKNGAVVGGVTGAYKGLGNASAAQVLAGKTFSTASLSNATGTMVDHTGKPNKIQNRRLANGRFEVAVDKGYHNCHWAGNSYEYMELSEVASTLGLTAAKLAQGQSVCGLTGTYKGLGNATAADVVSGKKFSTATLSNATGTMGTMAGGTYTPSTSKQTISCSGKKMTSNIIINAIPSSYVNTGSWTVFNSGTFSGNFGWVPQYVKYSKYYHPSPYDYSAQTMVKLGNIVYDDIEDGLSYGLPLLHKRNVVSGGPYLAFQNTNFSTGDRGVSYPASGNYLMLNRAIDISKYNYVDITYAIFTGNQDTHLSFVVCPTDKSTSGGYEFFIRRAVSSGDYTYTVDLKDLSFATYGRDSAPTGQNFIMFGASHDGTANSLYRICLRKVVFRQ